jgi:hypothetical protein
VPLKPRFSVKADISSGDHPNSNSLGTFNPLFPREHRPMRPNRSRAARSSGSDIAWVLDSVKQPPSPQQPGGVKEEIRPT